MTATPSPPRMFWFALAANMIWMNASEVWRYFTFVMPMMRAEFPQVANVAPMSLEIFARWAVWDTILIVSATGFFWLMLERFGAKVGNALLAATAYWASVFVIFWFGMLNMSLATPEIVLTALPLAWLELAVAALLTNWFLRRSGRVPSRA